MQYCSYSVTSFQQRKLNDFPCVAEPCEELSFPSLLNGLPTVAQHRIQAAQQRTHHFQKQVPHHQLKACVAHLSLLSRAGLSLFAQPGLQARVEALVQVSELRHLIENCLDLATGQNWLGGPGGGPQSLHGLEQKNSTSQLLVAVEDFKKR